MECLDIRYFLIYFFIYLLVLLIFGRYRLDAIDFNNLQDLEPEEFEQQVGEDGMCSLNMLNLCSFSL
jgi:hypothetical protein